MKGFHSHETTRTWDRLYYDEPLAIEFYDRAIQRVLELLRASEGDRVLDAGCGAGVHAIRMALQHRVVDAIDFSAAALEDGRERARNAHVEDRVRFAEEDLTRLSFADGSYDRVFSWGVLIHIPEIERALDELARVVAPGGRLVLYVSNAAALQQLPRRLRRLSAKGRSNTSRQAWGLAASADLHGESVWVWFNDTGAIVRHLEARGLRLIAREPGEFTDLHLHFSGALRTALRRLNLLWFRGRLPARLAHMNLLAFEKAHQVQTS